MSTKPNGAPTSGAPSGPAPESRQPENPPFNYDEWEKSIPAEARTKLDETYGQRYYEQFNDALGKEYGDVIPLIVETREDKTARERLGKIAADKELREFIMGPAYDAYFASRPAAPGSEAPAPADPRVDKLQQQVDEFTQQQRVNAYQAHRQTEYAALANEFPDLRFAQEGDEAYKRAERLLNYANRMTQDFGKPYPLRQAYDDLRAFEAREAPPAAPPTTHATEPRQSPQAPRTAVEGRDRAMQTIKKAGGFRELALRSRR